LIIQIAKVIKFTTNVDFKGIQEALLKEQETRNTQL